MIPPIYDIAPLKHGGDLDQAVERYGLPLEQWLDMSTGISPWPYPVGELGAEVWHTLPPADDKLIEAASQYYQAPTNNIVATPGSQITIRLLPQCLEASKVAVPSIGYQEHARSWRLAGHELCFYDNLSELLNLVISKQVEHAVLINPNNPSSDVADSTYIQELLAKTAGTLLIDEAFIDPYCIAGGAYDSGDITSAVEFSSPKLVVLRSVGKFFGLAGIRVGFAIGSNPLLTTLKSLLQPWSISYASQIVAQRALSDRHWQQQQVDRIRQAQASFEPLLSQLCKNINQVEIKHSLLFSTVFAQEDELVQLHQTLADQGVWTRLFNQGDNKAWLRFSLPAEVDELSLRLMNLVSD